MSEVKERMTEVIRSQPEDATYEDILRELMFEGMVARGLDDAREGRSIPNDEMKRRIDAWRS